MVSNLEFLNPVSKMFQSRHRPVFVNLSATNVGAVRAVAFCCGLLAASEIRAVEAGGLASSISGTPVCVNQIAVNEGAPKRFTVPAGGGADKFTLHRVGESEGLFAGEIKDGVGDFSSWKADTSAGTYVVRVVDGEKVVGESFPFEAGPRRLQLSLLQPMVDCMIDARSVVGTHPSAFNGAPWRHGSYYSHELASLVMLYLAFGEEIEKQPRQIDWPAERAKVLSAEFKLIPRGGDREMLEDTRRYFQRYDAPAKDAPDVVKLIHWGLGMTLVRPEIFDADGDGLGRQLHPQSVEQVAYVLALHPRLKKWLPDNLLSDARTFVEKNWQQVGLFSIPLSWHPSTYLQPDDPKMKGAWGPWMNPYKGRYAPGHSILPNLLMYEVARRDEMRGAERYLKAACDQARWVIQTLDWDDPRSSKGQRMSEHKTITGLVWLLMNYPDQAPSGLKASLEKWADVMTSRSNNMWDYRRYDLEEHWSIPVMNEPGSLGGFPACALSVSWVVEDPQKKQRLREIAYGALDNLFGRNPINAASPEQPELGWNGMIEQGWPTSGTQKPDPSRLGNVRGALFSAPTTPMFPYNPSANPLRVSGGTAFNAALNVGLTYLDLDERKGRARLPDDCLKKNEVKSANE